MNTNPTRQIAPYIQNVPAVPKILFRVGKVKVSRKHAAHNAKTAIDIAVPRMRLGKISEITTQVTGASVQA